MTLPLDARTSERSPRRIVLLVEDEPFVREATCQILQSAGFEVLPAADAHEAMDIYEHNGRKIDLLMTDMALPGRNGRQLAHDLRDTSTEIPILLTSGYVESECDSEPREPRTYFLPKPYSRSALVETMEKILSEALRRPAAAQAS
jgi:two-component system, cell cycle sensor histidine kinase and response regulator CckA